MDNSSRDVLPKRLYCAVPYDELSGVLEHGLDGAAFARTKSGARKRAKADTKLAVVSVRTRDAVREGVQFERQGKTWMPSRDVAAFLLTCRDRKALSALNAKRKVSAGGLIVSSVDDPRVMLMFRKKGDQTAWKTPKGGIGKGETPRQAATREVIEESGLSNVRVLGRLGRIQYFKNENGRLREKTVHLFLMVNRDGETGIAPREGEHFVSCEWLTPDDAIARVTQPQTRALIAKLARKAHRYQAGS